MPSPVVGLASIGLSAALCTAGLDIPWPFVADAFTRRQVCPLVIDGNIGKGREGWGWMDDAYYEDGKEKFSELGDWLSKNPTSVRQIKNDILTSDETFEDIEWTRSKTYPTVYKTWIEPLWTTFSYFHLQRQLAKLTKRGLSVPASSSDSELIDKFMETINK